MQFWRLCGSCIVAGTVFSNVVMADAERPLIDLGKLDPAAIKTRDAKVELLNKHSGARLRLSFGHKQTWPGIVLRPADGPWDLSAFGDVEADVKSLSPGKVGIGCRLDSVGLDRGKPPVQTVVDLNQGEQKTISVRLPRKLPAALQSKLFGMRGFPFGWSEKTEFDSGRVEELTIFASHPTADHVVEVLAIRVAGSASKIPAGIEDHLFPMIDRYGQFIHAGWPGKVKRADDFAQRRADEAGDLAKHLGPRDWDVYGGWRDGPAQKATGFFYPAKVDGKWWLVDPEGRLFWSHGIDCVRCDSGVTPITDRKHWFQDLPEPGTAWARFYGKGNWAPHGYYEGKSYETYDFSSANLARKYGMSWQEQFATVSQQRLRSWGMNTIANWSDENVYLLRKTPYVVTVHRHSKPLEGSQGYWGKFADVFDPSFRDNLRQRMAKEKDVSAGDPWCLGYFIDNELGWGDELSLAMAALASPPGQAAKRAFLDELKQKYGTVDALNRAWGTSHASWDALAQSRTPPEVKKANEDLAAFATRFDEQYFRLCREAVKEIAPKSLYLGCRFAWVNSRAVRAAAKYCDVVSFNRYQTSLAEFRLPEGVDKPVVIGEFHFGALDRGMFHTGLRPVANQDQRAKAYERYVRSALEHPAIVGTHWFEYRDQATTGRGDGENYQIGLVDIADTPYPETIEACRKVGYELYRVRLGK